MVKVEGNEGSKSSHFTLASQSLYAPEGVQNVRGWFRGLVGSDWPAITTEKNNIVPHGAMFYYSALLGHIHGEDRHCVAAGTFGHDRRDTVGNAGIERQPNIERGTLFLP